MFCISRCSTVFSAIYLIFSLILSNVDCIGQVIWAVNCGGDAHTDIAGIRYRKDTQEAGITSDFGRSMMIQRVPQEDQILYQTERYNLQSFSYNIPLKDDGHYVLVLKFSEVYFTSSNQKVFNVMLNGHHTVVEDLDIYHKVGRGVAHDELVPFTIRKGKLIFNDENSELDDSVQVEFVKGIADNPKINAMYVMKGSLEDVPKLEPLPSTEKPVVEEEDREESSDEEEDKTPKKPRRPAEPKIADPYASEDSSSMMFPIIVAIGAFVPIVFCLCKL